MSLLSDMKHDNLLSFNTNLLRKRPTREHNKCKVAVYYTIFWILFKPRTGIGTLTLTVYGKLLLFVVNYKYSWTLIATLYLPQVFY